MSQDINRTQVLQNIRVRSTLKKDGSWIHRSNDAKKEQDTAGTNPDVETKPITARSSQVRMAARRFEAIDPPPSSPLQKAEVISSEGNSVNQASAENIPAPNDTRPEGSTVKTKPQPPTKAPIQNFNAQPEKTFTEATAENTEQHADAPADTCHNEDKASADADVKNPPAEISAAEGTVRESSKSKSTAGVPGESVIKREPPNTTNLEHAGVNMYGPPALATSGKETSLQGGVETPAVSDATPEEETALQNSTISVTDTLPAPSSQSDADTAKSVEFKVESAPPSEPVFKSGTEEAVEREDDGTVVEQSFDPTPKTAGDCDKELNTEDALDQVAASDAEGVLDNTEHAAIRLTDALDVEMAKAEAVPKPAEDPRQPHSEATAENTEQHADAPADTCHNEDKASAEADVKNPPAEISAAEGTVRESSKSKSTAGVPGESVIKREPPNTTNLEHAGVNMYGPPALATSGKETSLQGGVETPAVSDATPEEETALQNSTISVTDTLPAPSSQSDADTAKSVEFKVESAPPSEPVFKSGPEEAVECEDDGTVVEQSFDATPKTAADCDKELNTEDALDQVAASDAEGVLDNTEHAAIRLTDALDVEMAKAEAVPKPVEDPRQPHSEATAENTEQHADAPADTCHNEDKASADADVKNPPAEISAAEGTVRESSKSKSTAGVPGESVIKREPPNTTNLEHAGVNMCGLPALATSGKEASLQGGVETPAVSDATPEEETALQNSTISVTDTLPAPSSQSDADTAKSVEFKVESAPPSEPVFKSGPEEAVEREDDGTVVEQSFDATPKTAADCDKELNIEDALDQVAASDAEGVLDNTEHAAIRLTDALDVETAKAEAVPKPVEDPRQPHSEEFKPNQKCDDSHTSDVSQKPAEDVKSTKTLNKPVHGQSPCYFCNQVINGNVKIIFSEPSMNCHPECLKCGVCARALGNMLNHMFLKDQVIQCGWCFSEAVKK
ncbi:uncharacterized protein si:dkey-125i10.3 [Oreochromis aureus]|uniref:uncharacterized protein si:dkey-125i10.3 n=1 Tax=Oreochromis aureus TaxID=47969 RepID=UPI00195398C4|nr:uncharacterized protein si:dkey-125i10.3 [Oreochromis aureus]